MGIWKRVYGSYIFCFCFDDNGFRRITFLYCFNRHTAWEGGFQYLMWTFVLNVDHIVISQLLSCFVSRGSDIPVLMIISCIVLLSGSNFESDLGWINYFSHLHVSYMTLVPMIREQINADSCKTVLIGWWGGGGGGITDVCITVAKDFDVQLNRNKTFSCS